MRQRLFLSLTLIAIAGLVVGLIVFRNRNTGAFVDTPLEIGTKPDAQVPGQDNVIAMNSEIVRIMHSYTDDSASNKQALADELKSVVEKRSELLDAIVKVSVSVFYQLVMPEQLVVGILPSDVKPLVEIYTTIEGEFEVVHFDQFDKKLSREEFYLVVGKQRYRTYTNDDGVEEAAGTHQKLTGVLLPKSNDFIISNQLHATKDVLQPIKDDSNIVSKTLPANSKNPTLVSGVDARTWLVVPINFTDDRTTYPIKDLADKLFNDQKSVTNFIKASTFNTIALTGQNGGNGDILPWLELNQVGAGCNYWNWTEEVIDRISAVNNYRYVQIVYPSNQGCWRGGQAYINGRYSYVEISGINDYYFRGTSSHEIGHNLGLYHANSIDCWRYTPIVYDPTSPFCRSVEYGDNVDTMGYGLWERVQFNVWNKYRLGTIPASSFYYSGRTGTSTYTISPSNIPSTNRKQAILIDNGQSDKYIVEYRALAPPFDNFGKRQFENDVNTGIRVLKLTGSYPVSSWLISNPFVKYGSPYYYDYPYLQVGRTFSSRHEGIAIKLISLDNNVARVQVTVNKTCVVKSPNIRATPQYGFLQPDRPLAFRLTIKNNSSTGCFNDSSFWVGDEGDYPQLQKYYGSFRGDTWGTTITVNPGTSQTTQLTITSAPVGYYTIFVQVSDQNRPQDQQVHVPITIWSIGR